MASSQESAPVGFEAGNAGTDIGTDPAATVVAARYEQDGAHVVIVRGEVDIDASGVLRHALEEGVKTETKCVVADFAGVTFCDSTGLNVLLQAHLAGDVRVAAPTAAVRRLLEVSGADGVLQIYPSVAEAIAAG
ncbi:STAS domain-containing protein [Streptomyces sp. TRM 70351]|uniref:STAS domain-containing protein n=1 Tax=Streptomyces sp. TRM 70351 TaxID=3116552 RepID=UPI002E7B6714|nr:STAS domain-containing protein [Streptomyces sp. TRM 70351]MEE1930338.1 STAS domain-containing protein [Streptomyces sp. TRM 70351]